MFYIDAAYDSLNKYGEELCGDHMEQVNLKDSKILVLSDGLGNGVKANILATMTSKIAATMLREGSTLDETIDTIVHTLPICAERRMAYSTFTILKIHKDGTVYAAEFDNPSIFLYSNGVTVEIPKKARVINDKIIYESNFKLQQDSFLVAVSDGVIHAGVGTKLSLGWEWSNVDEYIKQALRETQSPKAMVCKILSTCNKLYEDKPGDDAMALAVRIREQETINMFTGPPKNPENDYAVIEEILNSKGKIVVCGGTTANIVARTLGCEIEPDMSTITPSIPPVAKVQRIELVTEGVVTINKAVDIIKLYMKNSFNSKVMDVLYERNAASMLARLLIEDCSSLKIWFGMAVNPAHQDVSFTMDFDFKVNQIKELALLLENMGKEVNICYI